MKAKLTEFLVLNEVRYLFGVRIVRRGDRYGREGRYVHDEDDPLIIFYDLDRVEDLGPDFWLAPRAQQVSYYCMTNLLEDRQDLCRRGLNLQGGVPAWGIDGVAVEYVVRMLERFVVPADTATEADAEHQREVVTSEPAIVVNGVALSPPQAMAVRVAVSNYQRDLTGEHGTSLGEIGPLYEGRLAEVEAIMLQPPREGAHRG